MTREPIYAALFTRVAQLESGGSPLFRTVERRVRHWTDVPKEQMPYLGMTQDSESKTQVKRMPSRWVLRCSLYLYVHTGADADLSVVPSQLLNPLLDAVEAALAPTEQDENQELVNTLGGLAADCKIVGVVETSEGMLGDLEYALIPIEIVVPS